MQIKEALTDCETITALMTNYGFLSIDVAESLSGEKVCYIILNKTYGSVKNLFERGDINDKNFFFIEGISNILGTKTKKSPNCTYINVNNLASLNKAITKSLKDTQYLVFDSPTNLLTYHKPEEVMKFLKSLSQKLKRSKIKSIFCISNAPQYREFTSKVSKITEKIQEF